MKIHVGKGNYIEGKYKHPWKKLVIFHFVIILVLLFFGWKWQIEMFEITFILLACLMLNFSLLYFVQNQNFIVAGIGNGWSRGINSREVYNRNQDKFAFYSNLIGGYFVGTIMLFQSLVLYVIAYRNISEDFDRKLRPGNYEKKTIESNEIAISKFARLCDTFIKKVESNNFNNLNELAYNIAVGKRLVANGQSYNNLKLKQLMTTLLHNYNQAKANNEKEKQDAYLALIKILNITICQAS